MLKHLKTGLLRGLLFGVIYAWADTLFVYKVAKLIMKMNWNPFEPITLHIVLMDIAICVVLGGIIGLVAGKQLEERPAWFVFFVATGLAVVDAFATRAVDNMLTMGLCAIGIAHLIAFSLAWIGRNRPPRVAITLPLLAIVWFAAMRIGLPTELDRNAAADRPRPVAGTPNILWVVLDTVRADHLKSYGYARETSPNLDRLASEGALFEQAYSSAPWTLASHASMFTGKYSSRHWCDHESLYLDARNTSVAQILTAGGYDSIVLGGNPWFGDHSGLVRGFATLVQSWQSHNLGDLFVTRRLEARYIPGGEDKGAKQSNAAFSRWLPKQQESGRPFFAFFNYFEAHAPYHQVPAEDAYRFLPPGVTRDEAEVVSRKYMGRVTFADGYNATPRDAEIAKAVYDGGIYNADRRLGEVIEMLRKAGRLDDTLIIVNADHGEMFGEHEVYGHDLALYHPLVHVPLIMRYPGKVPAGARIDKPVQLLDLFSTVLEHAQMTDKVPAEVRGQSLSGVLAGGGDPERPVFAEYFRPKMRPFHRELRRMGFDPATFRVKSVQVGSFRLIEWPDRQKLFDVATDPGEDVDLSAQRPDRLATLRTVLEEFKQRNPPWVDVPGAAASAPREQLSPADEAKLRSLGYSVGGASSPAASQAGSAASPAAPQAGSAASPATPQAGSAASPAVSAQGGASP